MLDPEYAQYRFRLPRLERRHTWLPLLLDCHAVIDASAAAAIRAAPVPPACAEGCSACCHQSIPVTPLEAAGLKLYARHEMPVTVRRILAARLAGKESTGTRCAFLLGGSCAVYPLRPVACRRYIVLAHPCFEGEDATVTRPRDVLNPSRAALRLAMALTLPYYAALGETVPGPEQAFAFCAVRSAVLGEVAGSILG